MSKRVFGLRPAMKGRVPPKSFLALALLSSLPAWGTVLPAGTPLSVRLTTGVSSRSKPGDPVTAVLIAPVAVDKETALNAGTVVVGRVAGVRRHNGRARLELSFDSLRDEEGESEVPFKARVFEVDNAREAVTKDGVIVGLPGVTAFPSETHTMLLIAAHAHPLALALFEFGRLADRLIERVSIRYRPGVEMTLVTDEDVALPEEPLGTGHTSTGVESFDGAVSSLPLFATGGREHKRSDLTNVLVVGSEEEIQAAFAEAGWAQPANGRHALTKAFLALAESHGYTNAPVSLFRLGGRPPDLVYEKQNNTMAKRHHVRFWKLREEWEGRPVWLGAATHDVGIVFDKGDHGFSHLVDPEIDRERGKIESDLIFTGDVAASGLVPRPWAPQSFTSQGAHIMTDGQLAVLVLRPKPIPDMLSTD